MKQVIYSFKNVITQIYIDIDYRPIIMNINRAKTQCLFLFNQKKITQFFLFAKLCNFSICYAKNNIFQTYLPKFNCLSLQHFVYICVLLFKVNLCPFICKFSFECHLKILTVRRIFVRVSLPLKSVHVIFKPNEECLDICQQNSGFSLFNLFKNLNIFR